MRTLFHKLCEKCSSLARLEVGVKHIVSSGNNSHSHTYLLFSLVYWHKLGEGEAWRKRPISPHKNHRKISSSKQHNKANVQFKRGKGKVQRMWRAGKGHWHCWPPSASLLCGSAQSYMEHLWDHSENQTVLKRPVLCKGQGTVQIALILTESKTWPTTKSRLLPNIIQTAIPFTATWTSSLSFQ